MKGRIEATRLESRLLADNPLGDPSTRDVLVYVPPGYDDDRRRLPVVMILPGYGSNHRSLVAYDIWKPSLVERFERLLLAGECPEALLVLPDAITRWGGSQFVDSAATGPYQSYLADEVIPHVDARYRTIPRREARAVVGTSSGGFGALRLGMDRPDVVSVVGSHAGDAAFEVSLRPMFTPAAIAFEQAGGIEAFAERVHREGPRSSEFDAVCFVAVAAAYAPDLDLPRPHAALPFDPRTAEPIADVWARYEAHDPVKRIASRGDALRELRLVYLDAGDVDEHGLCFAARRMADDLRDLGVPLEHREFPGGHRGTSWRYEVSLPLLVGALERA